MTLHFHKYHGTGNDFIMINNIDGSVSLSKDVIQQICTRRFGIGSDGLILISPTPDADFEMEFYNPDGSQSMCGNGARCAVKFAFDQGIIGPDTRFIAIDGVHTGEVMDKKVQVSMRDVQEMETENSRISFINTGSPHVLIYSGDVDDIDVIQEGRLVRYNAKYQPGGTNVNFIEELHAGKIKVRTYERGVENETFSCGTGVTGASIGYGLQKGMNHIEVETKGGHLTVDFNERSSNHITDIYLCGPAEKVFEGTLEI